MQSPPQAFETLDLVNTAIALVGAVAAFIALAHSRAANKKSDKSIEVSQEANGISRDANRIAEHALKMQEDESRARIVVEPRMMILVGDGEDERPRPVVKVINLSKFPVTITTIFWKTDKPDKTGYYWKNPTIANPYGHLPARLEPRAALTAIGIPDGFKSLDDLLAIRSCAAFTDCGEEAEGMTDQWKEHCAKLAAEAKAKHELNAPIQPKS